MGKRNKKKKHQAYFANKINIYEDKNSCEIRKKKIKTRKKNERYISKYKHTHTQIYEMRMGEREREERETGITVIRTVSSAYVE